MAYKSKFCMSATLVVSLALLAPVACKKQPPKPPPPPPEVVSPADLPLAEVLSKHLAAMGGPEALAALRSVRKTGAMKTSDFANAPVTTEIRAGERYRRRVEQPGREILIGYDGRQAWQKGAVPDAPAPGPLSASETTVYRGLSDLSGALVDTAAKGHTVELLGKTENGYKVLVKLFGEVERAYYVDASTFLVNRVTEKRQFPGRTVEVVTRFSFYRAVDGVQWAFAESTRIEEIDFDQSLTWNTIETNVDLPDELFVMPQS